MHQGLGANRRRWHYSASHDRGAACSLQQAAGSRLVYDTSSPEPRPQNPPPAACCQRQSIPTAPVSIAPELVEVVQRRPQPAIRCHGGGASATASPPKITSAETSGNRHCLGCRCRARLCVTSTVQWESHCGQGYGPITLDSLNTTRLPETILSHHAAFHNWPPISSLTTVAEIACSHLHV